MEKNPVKVGVIGSGAISGIYLQNMTARFENLEVLAVASRHLDNAKKCAEEFGIKACSVEELLNEPEIEMIVNLTPVGVHYEIVKAALQAGKHVYTEKTITDDVEQARKLVKLATEKGLYLGSAPDTFLGAALQTARLALDDGILGEIHSFAISANRDNDLCTSLFSFLRQPGAGILNDYGVYYITALVSLLGPVKSVFGLTATPYPKRKNIYPASPEFGTEINTPNESIVSAVLRLQSGVMGTLHMNAESALIDEAYFAIYGTRGILYLTDPNQFGGTVRFQPNVLDPRKPAPRVELWNFAKYSENSRGIGPADMAEAIREGKTHRASAEMAVHVLEVLDGILKSGQRGSMINIMSKCERPEPFSVKSIGIRNIGHISYNMKNAETMLRFYVDVLGMQPQFTLTMEDMYEALKQLYADRECTLEERQRLQQIKEKGRKQWLTYLKVADRQFLELFYNHGTFEKNMENRWEWYGFTKVNYEVKDVNAVREKLVTEGIPLLTDIHQTADGAMELSVLDPDGNEVQFTQYPSGENSCLPLEITADEQQCSIVNRTTQIAFLVKDSVNMKRFYCQGLGLKKAATLTCGELRDVLQMTADKELLDELEIKRGEPWIDYIEVAPNQFIELFYSVGGEKKEERDLEDYYGYQHFCLEVRDIQETWNAVTENGIIPDTEISLGPDGAYQFWVTDPDGNRLEFMQYGKEAKQLQGD